MTEGWEPKDYVAAYAAVVSTVALILSAINTGWAIHIGRRDRAKIVLGVGSARFPIDADTAIEDLWHVRAANQGRRPVTLTSYGFELTNGRTLVPPMYRIAALPMKLNEGESYNAFVAIRSLQEAMQTYPPDVYMTALVFHTADGREIRMGFSRTHSIQQELRGPLRPMPKHLDYLNGHQPFS